MSDFPLPDPCPIDDDPGPSGPFDDPMRGRHQAVAFNRQVKDMIDGKIKPTPEAFLSIVNQAVELNGK